MTRIVALSDHVLDDVAPIVIRVGDEVEVLEQASHWVAFVHIRTASGEGWVPARYLSDERPIAAVTRIYDTTELPVAAGEEVELLEDDPESGWAWCEAADGRRGWVPHEVLGIAQPPHAP